jgi:hypothetical protein
MKFDIETFVLFVDQTVRVNSESMHMSKRIWNSSIRKEDSDLSVSEKQNVTKKSTAWVVSGDRDQKSHFVVSLAKLFLGSFFNAWCMSINLRGSRIKKTVVCYQVNLNKLLLGEFMPAISQFPSSV